MEFFLVRHGETLSNIERRYQGWTESPLSPQGLLQAEQTGFYLSGMGITALYCSDLLRAQKTAQTIGASCLLRPIVNPLLREINFGKWEGLTFAEIGATWGNVMSRWLDDPFSRAAPDGETLEKVCTRMLAFLEALTDEAPEHQRIAVVSHGGSIRVLLHHILGYRREGLWDIKVDNASISLIQKEDGLYRVIYCNRVHHLKGKGNIGVFNDGDQ